MTEDTKPPLTTSRVTLVIGGLTALALLLSLPGSLRAVLERGELYLFTTLFFADIAPRLTGPGRLRFLLQPVVALLLGVRDGRVDLRAGREPYIWALVTGLGARRELLRSAFASISNVVLAAILCDAIAQWLLFRVVSPGAALVIGPVLICAPYALARALANRGARVVRTLH